jgi:hypothetical protein
MLFVASDTPSSVKDKQTLYNITNSATSALLRLSVIYTLVSFTAVPLMIGFAHICMKRTSTGVREVGHAVRAHTADRTGRSSKRILSLVLGVSFLALIGFSSLVVQAYLLRVTYVNLLKDPAAPLAAVTELFLSGWRLSRILQVSEFCLSLAIASLLSITIAALVWGSLYAETKKKI